MQISILALKILALTAVVTIHLRVMHLVAQLTTFAITANVLIISVLMVVHLVMSLGLAKLQFVILQHGHAHTLQLFPVLQMGNLVTKPLQITALMAIVLVLLLIIQMVLVLQVTQSQMVVCATTSTTSANLEVFASSMLRRILTIVLVSLVKPVWRIALQVIQINVAQVALFVAVITLVNSQLPLLPNLAARNRQHGLH
jgi:hypothetical protein